MSHVLTAAQLKPGHFIDVSDLPDSSEISTELSMIRVESVTQMLDSGETLLKLRGFGVSDEIVVPSDCEFQVSLQDSNTGFLEGLACPNCHAVEAFDIGGDSPGSRVITDDHISDESDLSFSWGAMSSCVCMSCSFVGRVVDFMLNLPHEEHLDAIQSAVLAAYSDEGLTPSIQKRSDLATCGDGLLRFLMTECSSAEDCFTVDDAKKRIESAIYQLTAVASSLK